MKRKYAVMALAFAAFVIVAFPVAVSKLAPTETQQTFDMKLLADENK